MNSHRLKQRFKYGVRKVSGWVSHAWDDRYRAWLQPPSAEIINEKELRIIGMRRTGNHAVIHWLRQLYRARGEASEHLNDLILNESPYRYKYENLRDHHPEYPKMMAAYRRQAQGNFTPRPYLSYSYEDYSLQQIANQPRLDRNHDLYLGRSGERWDVLILRDPFNLFASRLKSKFMAVKAPGKTMVELWLDYAAEFLGQTQMLRQPKVCINYNRWCLEPAYRQALAEQLRIPYQAVDTEKVSGSGGGSSFDDLTFQGKASEMDTLGRWRHFQDQPRYRALFQNPQLWDYSERIFGTIPGTDVLRSPLTS